MTFSRLVERKAKFMHTEMTFLRTTLEATAGTKQSVQPNLSKPVLCELCTVRLLCMGNPAQHRHSITAPGPPPAPSLPGKSLIRWVRD